MADIVSDGVLSYLSLIVSLFAFRPKLVLLDEPGVYLFPSLVRRVGELLSQYAVENGANVIVATHSPDLLLGSIVKRNDLTIARLTFRDQRSKTLTINPEQLQDFLRRPLVRSSNALNALFAHGAIVSEDDNDRVIYEAMLMKLQDNQFDGDVIYILNARGKTSIHEIVKPLRAFGIPAAAVVDIDVLDDKHVWKRIVDAVGVPDTAKSGLIAQRPEYWEKAVGEVGPNELKRNGLRVLSKQLRDDIGTMFEQTEKFGLFIVPVGALEGWIAEVQPLRNKTEWASKALQHLDLVPPGEGLDEWRLFISRIIHWIRDPLRRGTGITYG